MSLGRIGNDPIAPSQRDAAIRMFAAGGLENGARELGADSASEDTLYRVAACVVPQLYSKG
jgi:hypothetical protein